MSYGFYKMIGGNVERRQLKVEKREVRATILPFLQAEEDARYLQQVAKRTEIERRIMQGVPGFEAGKNHYNTTWMPPFDNKFG